MFDPAGEHDIILSLLDELEVQADLLEEFNEKHKYNQIKHRVHALRLLRKRLIDGTIELNLETEDD